MLIQISCLVVSLSELLVCLFDEIDPCFNTLSAFVDSDAREKKAKCGVGCQYYE